MSAAGEAGKPGALSGLIRLFKERHRGRLVDPGALGGVVLLTGSSALSFLGRSWGVVGPWTCPSVLGVNTEPLPAPVLEVVSEPCLSEFKDRLVKRREGIFVDVTNRASGVFLRADRVLCRPPVVAYLEHLYGCALRVEERRLKRCVRPVVDFLFEPGELDEIRKGIKALASVLGCKLCKLLEAAGLEEKP